MQNIYKFNSGAGANLCNKCNRVISIGKKTNEIMCNKCKQENNETNKRSIRKNL